jgi:hypothetical protein
VALASRVVAQIGSAWPVTGLLKYCGVFKELFVAHHQHLGLAWLRYIHQWGRECGGWTQLELDVNSRRSNTTDSALYGPCTRTTGIFLLVLRLLKIALDPTDHYLEAVQQGVVEDTAARTPLHPSQRVSHSQAQPNITPPRDKQLSLLRC